MSKNRQKSELRPKQIQAIAALLSHPTAAAAARSCKVSERAMRGWLKEPAFKQALAEAEAAAMSEASRQLARLATASVVVLAQVMTDISTPPAIRASAARSLLTIALSFRQHTDLEERLARLEENINQNSE